MSWITVKSDIHYTVYKHTCVQLIYSCFHYHCFHLSLIGFIVINFNMSASAGCTPLYYTVTCVVEIIPVPQHGARGTPGNSQLHLPLLSRRTGSHSELFVM